MLNTFPIAISIISKENEEYIYKYMNNYCMNLFNVEQNTYINKPIGYTYNGDYSKISDFYKLVDQFFNSHRKELHSIVTVPLTKDVNNLQKFITNNDLNLLDKEIKMYVVIVSINYEDIEENINNTINSATTAVVFASLESFSNKNNPDPEVKDFILLLNRADADIQHMKKTLFYGNGTEAVITRITKIDSQLELLNEAAKEVKEEVKNLRGTLNVLTWLSKSVTQKWVWVIVIFTLTTIFSLDIDKTLWNKFIVPLMKSNIEKVEGK